MQRPIHRLTALAGISLILFVVVGCSKLPIHHEVEFDFAQFDRAVSKIDRMTESIDKAIADLRKESAAWREAVGELEKQLHEDGKDLLANEVRINVEALSKGLEDAWKSGVDYVEAKVKDNLKAFRVALDRARNKVREARGQKNKNGIKEAFDELARVVVFPQPVVTGFIPAHAELRWNDYSQTTGYGIRVPLIEVRGWGFERPVEEAARFGVSLVTRDASGKIVKERALPMNGLYSTSRYLMQIKLDAPGVQLAPDDDALVFKLGPTPADWRFLPINQVRPEDPAVARARAEAQEKARRDEEERKKPRVVAILLYVGTTWNDKDREITFHYTIHRKSDGHQIAGISVGRDEVWPDPSQSKPDWRHFTIPINGPADRFTEGDRLGYRLHVRYDSYRGDPTWNGRLRAEAVLSDGRIIPVLVETADFTMGHLRDGPERGNRDFDFNK